MVRNKIDYGAALLVGALDSHQEKIEVAQNRNLRIIIGAARSTPIALLNLETGITSVLHRWMLLASIYFIILNERRTSIAYETAYDLAHYPRPWKIRNKPSGEKSWE